MNKLWSKFLDWMMPTRRSRRSWKWLDRWNRAVNNCRSILYKGEPSEERFRRWERHANKLNAIIEDRNKNFQKYWNE